MNSARRGGVFLFGVFCFSSVIWAQGPLVPSGAPAPSMRTLQQIEPRTPIGSVPFVISQPGSYYFTGPLHHSGTGVAIEIAASDVTLDGGGFTLTGNPSSGDLIAVSGTKTNVRIRSTNLGSSGEDGVEVLSVRHLILEDVHVRDCAGAGVRMSSGVIRGLVAEDNGGPGVFMGNPVPGIGIVVKKHPNNLHVQRNGGGGVVIEGDFDVELAGVFHGNTGHGISWSTTTPTDGLRMKLEDCDVARNTGDGLHLAGASSAEAWCEMANVTFSHNDGAGVFANKPVPSIGIVVKKNPGTSARINNNGAGGLVLEGDCDVEFAGVISGNTGHGISWSPLNPGDRITFTAKEGASVDNTGDGLHFAALGPVDAVCDLAEFSFERNGGDGIHIQLPHTDSYLSILHHQGRLMDNAGDGMDITAGRSGNQGFFDIAMARNAGRGCGKIDGGSNPGSFVRCVVQDNGLGGLDLVGGSWTLAESVIKGNGGDGVAVGAKIHDRKGHVTLMKRGCTVEDNQGHGVRVYPAEIGASAHVVIEQSRATGNTGSGFLLDAGALGSGTFRDSVIQNNDGRGLDLAGSTWTLEGSAVNDNGSDGIVVSAKKHTRTGHVTLMKRGCSAARNGGDGVHISSAENDATCRVVIEHSLLNGNTGSGLHLETTHPGSVAALSWLNSHASANDAHGVVVTGSVGTGKGTITMRGGDCDDSGSHGIVIAHPEIDAGLITGVSASRSGGSGIVSASHSISIVGNFVSRNAAAGIRVDGDNHYLADNQCVQNPVGIELAGNNNALAKNVYGGALVPFIDMTGTNPSAPIQDVSVGVNPLGNIIY